MYFRNKKINTKTVIILLVIVIALVATVISVQYSQSIYSSARGGRGSGPATPRDRSSNPAPPRRGGTTPR